MMMCNINKRNYIEKTVDTVSGSILKYSQPNSNIEYLISIQQKKNKSDVTKSRCIQTVAFYKIVIL
jgi:hypothetical protein